MRSGARFFADVLLGLEAMDAPRLAEARAFITSVVRARRFPLHVTNLWNALYVGFDLDEGAYFAQGIDPDRLPLRQMHQQSTPLPVGAFLRVKAGERELWAEVVYKEGRHPRLLLDPGDLFRQVDPAVSGAPGIPEETNGRTVARVCEGLVLDFNAFGENLNELGEKKYERVLRKGWLDQYGHLECEALYDPPERAADDDTTAYARYLFDHHRGGMLGRFENVFLARAATDDEVWTLLLASFNTVQRIAESCPDLASWRGYFFDRARYQAQVADMSSDAFLGDADLRRSLKELRVARGDGIGYRSLRHELLELLAGCNGHPERRAQFEGPAYATTICHVSRWLADEVRAEAGHVEAMPERADDAYASELEALIDEGAREIAKEINDPGEFHRWLRPTLARRLEFHFRAPSRRRARRDASPRLRRAVFQAGQGQREELDRLLEDEEFIDLVLAPRERLAGRERRIDQLARLIVARRLRSERDGSALGVIVDAFTDRALYHYRQNAPTARRDLRIDDDWQSGGIWRCETLRAGSSLLGIPPTLPMGLGYASTHPPSAPAPVAATVLATSLTGWRVALTERDLGLGELRLTREALGEIHAPEGTIDFRLRHGDGDVEANDARIDRESCVLTGVRWPLDAIPGMIVRCQVERHGSIVRARSEHLVPPHELGGELVHYAVDEDYFLRHRQTRPLERSVRESSVSLRDLILAAFKADGEEVEGRYRLSLPDLLTALLGPEFEPAQAAPIIVAVQTMELERDGEFYCWRPRVSRRTRAIERTLLEEFGLTRERRRQLVRHVVPMHIRQYRQRHPSPQKIRDYAAARAASGDPLLPEQLPLGASWVREYQIGAEPANTAEEA